MLSLPHGNNKFSNYHWISSAAFFMQSLLKCHCLIKHSFDTRNGIYLGQTQEVLCLIKTCFMSNKTRFPFMFCADYTYINLYQMKFQEFVGLRWASNQVKSIKVAFHKMWLSCVIQQAYWDFSRQALLNALTEYSWQVWLYILRLQSLQRDLQIKIQFPRLPGLFDP